MISKSNVSAFTLIPVLCVLTLFLLLSFVSVSVIIAGSGVYEGISHNMDQNYEKRVTLSYLTTKIRQNDCGNISIKEVNGINMLAIKEEFWGWEFVTYLYYDAESSCIREIFLEVENGRTIDFALRDGEEIISSHGFEFNLSDNCAEIIMIDEKGVVHTSRVSLRSKAG
jgi:hypothetical protein